MSSCSFAHLNYPQLQDLATRMCCQIVSKSVQCGRCTPCAVPTFQGISVALIIMTASSAYTSRSLTSARVSLCYCDLCVIVIR